MDTFIFHEKNYTMNSTFLSINMDCFQQSKIIRFCIMTQMTTMVLLSWWINALMMLSFAKNMNLG